MDRRAGPGGPLRWPRSVHRSFRRSVRHRARLGDRRSGPRGVLGRARVGAQPPGTRRLPPRLVRHFGAFSPTSRPPRATARGLPAGGRCRGHGRPSAQRRRGAARARRSRLDLAELSARRRQASGGHGPCGRRGGGGRSRARPYRSVGRGGQGGDRGVAAIRDGSGSARSGLGECAAASQSRALRADPRRERSDRRHRALGCVSIGAGRGGVPRSRRHRLVVRAGASHSGLSAGAGGGLPGAGGDMIAVTRGWPAASWPDRGGRPGPVILALACAFVDVLAIGILLRGGTHRQELEWIAAAGLHLMAVMLLSAIPTAQSSRRWLSVLAALAVPGAGFGVSVAVLATRGRGTVLMERRMDSRRRPPLTSEAARRLAGGLSPGDALHSADDEQRRIALLALTRRADPEAMTLLRRAAADRNPDLALSAALALDEIRERVERRASRRTGAIEIRHATG